MSVSVNNISECDFFSIYSKLIISEKLLSRGKVIDRK